MRIILTENQYKKVLLSEMTINSVGEKKGSFDIELGGELIKRWNKNNKLHVQRVQKMLLSLDYDLGNYGPNKDGVDGIYGPYTEQSVKDFQEDSMPEQPDQHDGVIGPITYELLKTKVDELAEEEGITPDEVIEKPTSIIPADTDTTPEPSNHDMVKGKNGNLPLDKLMFIGYDDRGQKEYLHKRAGRRFKQMQSDALEDGVEIKVSDAYRICGHPDDLENGIWSQWAAWEKYNHNPKLASKPDPDTKEEWIKKGGGWCKSLHGKGKAIDVSGTEARKWVRDNGRKYGFKSYKYEDWHFDYKELSGFFNKG